MKGKKMQKVALVSLLALSMALTGCGKSGGSKKETVVDKNTVYQMTDFISSDQIEGSVSGVCATADKLYIYSSDWVDLSPNAGEDGEEVTGGELRSMATEDAAVFEEATEEATDSVESEDMEAAETEETEVEDAEAVETEEAVEEDATDEEAEAVAEEDATDEEAEAVAEEDASEAVDAIDEGFAVDGEEYLSKSIYHFYTANLDGTNMQEIASKEVMSTDNSWLNYFQVGQDGTMYLLYSGYDEVSGKSTYQLTLMDANGQESNPMDLGDFFKGEDSYVGKMLIGQDGSFYLTGDQNIYGFDAQGKKTFAISGGAWISATAMSKDGNILVYLSAEEGMELRVLDTAKKELGDKIDLGVTITSYGNSVLINSLTDEYDFYINDGSGILGYKLADKSSNKLLDWVSSNVTQNYVNDVYPLADGNFIINYYDYYSEGDAGLYLMKKVDPSQVTEKKLISYGGLYVDDMIKAEAVAFNKSQDEYQVVFKDYSTAEDPEKAFNADLLAGDIPDIIDMSYGSIDKYVSKGMLEDLYGLMENDPDINKTDFQENVLSIMERDGKLYRISPSYNIYTLVARESDLKGKDKFTVKDLMELEQAKGKDVKGFYMQSNTGILNSFCSHNYNDYIDWTTGKCSFDSPEFIDMLEYAATYPKDEDIEWSEDMESQSSMIRNKKVLFAEIYSMSFEEIELYEKMFDGDLTFRGYPSETHQGAAVSFGTSFAISSKSKNKEGAWAFVKRFLTEDYYSNANRYYGGMPLRKDCLENEFKKYTATEAYTDKFGNEIQPLDSSWGYDDIEVQIRPLNAQQEEKVREVIASVDHEYVYNTEIVDIINEEAKAFFEGQKSAQEVAGIIQNRVSTFVNESR